MFEKLMNNYYFGKAGKGDLTPDDLPTSRWQLFMETLRTRFSALLRLNLLYMIVWLPAIIVLIFFASTLTDMFYRVDFETNTTHVMQVTNTDKNGVETTTMEQLYSLDDFRELATGSIGMLMLLLIPCIGITGPFTAGISYVTRNWARDEHAFIWSDFKDAVKANWKQSLVISFITGLLPVIIYTSWTFYGGLAQTQMFMVVPQMLVVMIGIIWAISVTYMYPLIVSYELRLRDVIRNALLLAIARLPMSVGIRLLHCVPVVIGVVVAIFFNVPMQVIMVLFLYYVFLGFSLSRFVTASYTNGVFDKFINARIEGAKVNQGLHENYGTDDEDDEDDEEDEDDDQ